MLFTVSIVCISCNRNKNNASTITTDTINVAVECDSSITSDVDSSYVAIEIEDDVTPVISTEKYDWTPEGFKTEHYDEWVVVHQAIDVQQEGGGKTDFSKIDSLVNEYIRKKNIEIPSDRYSRIMAIEKICVTKFDISGYDYSNFGMNIADGTAILFEEYVSWLLASEAKKLNDNVIDFQEEDRLTNELMDAFTMCCDSIGSSFEGSGGWEGYSYVYRMENNFKRSNYNAVFRPRTHKTQPFLLSAKHFKDECETRIANYKPVLETSTSPEAVKRLYANYYNAIKQWLIYRDSVEKEIADPKLKAEYSYLTRSFAREHYIHLKNCFWDIRRCEFSFCENVILKMDCSDREMLDFSFEKSYNEELNK